MVDIGIIGYVNWLQLQSDLFLVNLYDRAQTFPIPVLSCLNRRKKQTSPQDLR